ncbi:lipocalin family protein [Flavitalea sp. BT771]|uniref:lipocalin family protein n=1 Tax=Flavitalea sp. BT771 TaxID=3063329 RepID=UPI0026E19ADB|nr:lipocalin family protein [Flavitalea sp. BT771]MDO6435002.1 lipocalin family protein [Flavitalea sp. BT771]MDV6223902.1 lipocalin family protein [Flavitalea sp. BT771]
MKIMFLPILFVTAFAACRRDDPGMPSPQAKKITGKWNIITVTVIPRDSTGKAINDGTVYTEPSYYYFQFNTNFTWVENLAPDVTPIGESGTYRLHGDTAFTLVNEHVPSQPEECKIVTLTDTTFVFSHQRPTLYNGITPGFLEYVFKLRK